MANERMKNPINFRSIVMMSPLFVGAPLIGFIWTYLEDGFDWFAVAVWIVLGLIAFMLPTSLEIVDRPKAVEVTDSGVVLYQRFGRKPVFVPWLGMKKLNHTVDEPSKVKRKVSSSYLFVTEKKSYTLDWKIAEVVRERYRSQVGEYPLNESYPNTGLKTKANPYRRY